MTKGQHDCVSKMKDSEVQMTFLRHFIIVKSVVEYMLHFILIPDGIGLCFLDFPRVCEDLHGTLEW